MPQIRLDVNDAGELAEMLESLSQWLGSDPALETSFGRWIGHPGYGINDLRQDLDRFTFLLGGHDGEHWLDPPGDQGNHAQLTGPGLSPQTNGKPGLTRDPRGRPPSGPRPERVKDPARRRRRLRPPAPCQASLSPGGLASS